MPPVSPNGVRVLQRDRVVEVVGAHHAEHRSEALGAVEPRARLHADAHARRPQPSCSAPHDRRCGSTSHVSPASSVVRPAAAVRDGGPISGPIIVAGSIGRADAQRCARVGEPRAGTSGRRTPAPSTIARLAAEHFWPACPNAERTRSRIARSRSAGCGDDDRVLAARLGEQAQRRLPVEEQLRRVVGAR